MAAANAPPMDLQWRNMDANTNKTHSNAEVHGMLPSFFRFTRLWSGEMEEHGCKHQQDPQQNAEVHGMAASKLFSLHTIIEW